MTHAAGTLGAAVDGMEKATVKILKSTEVIDESAKALAAALRTDDERGLVQDIQEREYLRGLQFPGSSRPAYRQRDYDTGHN